jgi:Mlc titration factor MtfA (ptsG expression regulator)
LRALLSARTVEIPQELWAGELTSLRWLRHWSAREIDGLRQLCAAFLAAKSMTGVAGLVLTPEMQLHIAAQACVPIARLGLEWYGGWSGIVVYPAAFRVRRHEVDPAGVVSEVDAELTGEAWDGGPVILSWEDAAPAAGSAPEAAACNVVIHEFAHKIDLLDGDADGIPPFDPRKHPGLRREAWAEVLEDAYERFCAELDLVDAEIPPDVDPESEQGERYYAHLPLDPYAATDPGEFFAVSSESFFLDPQRLELAFPEWFRMLRSFYRPA